MFKRCMVGLSSCGPPCFQCWILRRLNTMDFSTFAVNWLPHFYLVQGVSNSNPLKGRMSMKKCSACRRLKEKVPCGRHFIEEGFWRPHILSNMMLFLHLIKFQSIFTMKVPTFQQIFIIFLNFELNTGHVFETPDLGHVSGSVNIFGKHYR